MAFEITDLMIQVVTGSPHVAALATRCETLLTCKKQGEPPTNCSDAVTCKKPDAPPTNCDQHVTCKKGHQSGSRAELDALLEQLRMTLAAETATV
jgi:hypothetical protein